MATLILHSYIAHGKLGGTRISSQLSLMEGYGKKLNLTPTIVLYYLDDQRYIFVISLQKKTIKIRFNDTAHFSKFIGMAEGKAHSRTNVRIQGIMIAQKTRNSLNHRLLS